MEIFSAASTVGDSAAAADVRTVSLFRLSHVFAPTRTWLVLWIVIESKILLSFSECPVIPYGTPMVY